jgi:hypothetical protein
VIALYRLSAHEYIYRVSPNDLRYLKYLFNKNETAYRHETHTVGRRTSDFFFVAYGRSDVNQTTAGRDATVNMAVERRLNSKEQIEFAHGGFLRNFLQKSH